MGKSRPVTVDVHVTDPDPIGDPSSRATPIRSNWLRWPVLVTLFGVGIVAWGLMTPPMGVPDEPAYAVHAVALWSGQVASQPTPEDAAAKPLAFGNGRWFRIPKVWGDGYYQACFAYHPEKSAKCGHFGAGSTEIADVPDTLGYTVQPAWPLLVGWMGRLAPGTVGLYGMRFVGALASAVLLAAAVRALATSVSAQLALVGVIAAATPMAYFMMGSVNPNGLEIASAICVWAHALALARWRPAQADAAAPVHLLVGLAVSGGILAFTRPLSPLYLAFALVIGAVTAVPGRLRAWWQQRRARVTAVIVAAAVMVPAAVVFVGDRSARGYDSRQPLFRLSLVWPHVVQTVGNFGWIDTPVGRLALPWAVGVGVLVVGGLVYGTARLRLGLVLVCGASFASLTLVSIPGAGGWQGRYGLPLVVGAALVSVTAIGARQPRGEAVVRVGAPLLALTFAIAATLAFHKALQRFTLGLPAGWTANVFAAEWQPPGGSILCLLLVVASSTASVVIVVKAGERTIATRPTEVPAGKEAG